MRPGPTSFGAASTVLVVTVLALHAPPSPAQDYTVHRDGLEFRRGGETVRLQVCDSGTVRVTVRPDGGAPFRASLAVTKKFGPIRWSHSVDAGSVVLRAPRLRARYDLRSGTLAFLDRRGNLLLQEPPDNPRELTSAVVAGENIVQVRQRFRLAPGEGIYGLGQFEQGEMNYRGKRVTLIQNNRHVVVPFLHSSKAYGIFWDNTSHTEFEDGPGGMSFWSEVADGIDYYLIVGDDMDGVIAGLREATGRAPLWPRWALGYWQSKERYETQDQLMSVAREFRARKLPIDNIVLDWQYWGSLGWNAMDFDRKLFPDPKGMIDSLHRLYNLQLMISIWPQVDSATAVYRELKNHGHLYPTEIWNGGKTYDAYSPRARAIFWDHLNRGLYSLGVDAWWVDATEPDWKWCDSLLEEKEGIVRNGETAIGSSTRYLNSYALMATTGIYENQRRTNPDRRVVMLTRSAFVGQQRNSAAVWSGDISSNWQTFRNQIAGGINFSMAGIPYWNSDIGGFLPKEFSGEYPLGPRDPAYRELYVRWFQFGAFCPVFRAHGTDFPREVWQFGEPGDWAYDALVRFLKLRYRLLPYLYSVSWMVTAGHSTMMRGLPMDFRDDPRALNIGSAYMFGPALLVAPVTRPLYYPKHHGTIVPAEAFSTQEGQSGLSARYFRGMKFDTLAHTRTDSVIRFDWSADGAPGVGRERFSVRWSGMVRPRETGRYEFEAISDDGVNLFVGGRQLMDEMYFAGKQMNVGEIDLKADSLVPFVFEYYQESGGAQVTLTWRTPSMLKACTPRRGVDSVEVYLPGRGDFYDFWTGERLRAGETVRRPAPIDEMPLYVKAGSVLPLGCDREYVRQRPDDTLEIRVYPGADGRFILYEDEGDGYAYERGEFSEIPLEWDDARGTLTIGRRRGGFPGMLKNRTLRLVAVREGRGAGPSPALETDALIRYSGSPVIHRMPSISKPRTN